MVIVDEAERLGKAGLLEEREDAYRRLVVEKPFGADLASAQALNQRLLACFQAILLQPNGQQPSELFRHSAEVDRATGQFYYSKPEELCARAFEAFVQDAPIKNHFLVKGTRRSPEAARGLYPQGEQRERINQRFHDYFLALGSALARSTP